jgi:hypothetical protein
MDLEGIERGVKPLEPLMVRVNEVRDARPRAH